MTEIPDDEVEAAAKAFHEHRFGTPWHHVAEAFKQGSRDDIRVALAAVRPRWEKQLAEAVEEARSDGYAQGYSDGQEVAHND